MKCRNCGRRIRLTTSFNMKTLYVHDDGFATCDLDRTHPNFMMVSAEPEES